MTEKKVSYKGTKAMLPENVSIKAFKEIVEMCGGYKDLIQPMIYFLSRKLFPLQRKDTQHV